MSQPELNETPFALDYGTFWKVMKSLPRKEKVSYAPYLPLVTEHQLRRCNRNVIAAIILRMTEVRLTEGRSDVLYQRLHRIMQEICRSQNHDAVEAMAVLAKVGYVSVQVNRYTRTPIEMLNYAHILADILPSCDHDMKKEVKRVQFHLGRASRVALSATLTTEQWIETLNHFNWRCAFCSAGEYEVLEHFIPLIHGGGTTQYNCIPACSSCNSRKNDMHPSMIPPEKGISEAIQYVHQYLETRRMWADAGYMTKGGSVA